ncbi:hypothetical protein OGV37_15230 [Citrobacter sp. Cb010]|uniref:hypothetical protein n=1 Tax=unclassified Citrobacter TaxID=2644389 RepID=UPI0015E4FECA|nr:MULTISPECIES: hypothetical protein [unclassified Citrobacter]MBA8328700.1 hypothetical protein [Citrobacter freundii]HBC8789002.1 hypothetical protein [Citrobacter braakii]MBA8332806.1 hypothetical protein [Citrobacter freundii]MDM3376216.1 hypothetical protein [Citrobacter sp. Cb010]MDM3459429.1 hypothetical protein [Citrobacter sp. Cb036]
MRTSERYPVTSGDIIVNTASRLFSVTEITADQLPAPVYCGDILNSETFALWNITDASGVPFINLTDCEVIDVKPRTLVRVDRNTVIADFYLRAADDASKKEALKRITADGSIRLAINSDYFKA